MYCGRTCHRVTMSVYSIVHGLLLECSIIVRNTALPPELVRRRPFHAARRVLTSKLLQDNIVMLELTCSQRRGET
jgi:hypothetical protein